MGRPERYGLSARRFVAYGRCRCVAATDGGSPSLPFCSRLSRWERRTRERQGGDRSGLGRGGRRAKHIRSFERTRYREAFSAHCGCLLCCVLDCTGDPSARSQRLVARKSPRRYIAKGSNGGTPRRLTENLTYTGLTACMASAI